MSCEPTETNGTRFELINMENLEIDRGPVLRREEQYLYITKLNISRPME